MTCFGKVDSDLIAPAGFQMGPDVGRVAQALCDSIMSDSVFTWFVISDGVPLKALRCAESRGKGAFRLIENSGDDDGVFSLGLVDSELSLQVFGNPLILTKHQ